MTDIRCDSPSPGLSGSFDRTGSVFTGLDRAVASAFGQLVTWQTRISQRHHLAALDDRLLQDAGFSHADAEREARKPFWRE